MRLLKFAVVSFVLGFPVGYAIAQDPAPTPSLTLHATFPIHCGKNPGSRVVAIEVEIKAPDAGPVLKVGEKMPLWVCFP